MTISVFSLYPARLKSEAKQVLVCMEWLSTQDSCCAWHEHLSLQVSATSAAQWTTAFQQGKDLVLLQC